MELQVVLVLKILFTYSTVTRKAELEYFDITIKNRRILNSAQLEKMVALFCSGIHPSPLPDDILALVRHTALPSPRFSIISTELNVLSSKETEQTKNELKFMLLLLNLLTDIEISKRKAL